MLQAKLEEERRMAEEEARIFLRSIIDVILFGYII